MVSPHDAPSAARRLAGGPPIFSRAPTLGSGLLALLGSWLFVAAPVLAQKPNAPPLQLGGLLPGGVRASSTDGWGAYEFNVTNLSGGDRLARVLMMFDGRPDTQYGRDTWAPAHAVLATWMLVGPAPAHGPEMSREIQSLLYDRTEGGEHLVLPPGEERVRSRGILYRKREPFTTILLDPESPAEPPPGQLPQPDSTDEEALRLARAFRLTHKMSDWVPRLPSGPLPPMAQTFDSIDHFILASNHIAHDPGGMRALRRWLERGGKVWVMLDLVEPETVAPLLGDALDFTVVDRVSLTAIQIDASVRSARMEAAPVRKYERPVAFVRVQLPPGERVKHTVEGWPVWFTRHVGRGEVIFTALGPDAWYLPRTKRDPPSPYQDFPHFPIPDAVLEDLSLELQPSSSTPVFHFDSFQPMLTEEIGYSVVRRGTVVLIFGVALLAALSIGLLLRRSHRPELLGWLGPAAALSAAGVFLAVGEASRRAAPPTVAVGQILNTVSGKGEIAVHGQFAVYRPDSGPAAIGAPQGGFFDLDRGGVAGQTQRFVMTDAAAWHWENLTLPAGVRVASFRTTISLDKPIAADAHFGPSGVEGRLDGPFEELSDALICTPAGRNLAVAIQPDGAFHAGRADILPRDQFLASAVLSDRQQRRQAIYRDYLGVPRTGALRDGPVLLAWCQPLPMHFDLVPEARQVGGALVVAPLRMNRPPPGERVTIPGPFVTAQRILPDGPTKLTLASSQNADMHLRFLLPAETLPFQLERARLSMRLEAPARRVVISGRAGEQWIELHRVDSPLDPFHVEIADPRVLHLDKEGGLHLNLTITGLSKDAAPQEQLDRLGEKWTLEYLELEATGTANVRPAAGGG